MTRWSPTRTRTVSATAALRNPPGLRRRRDRLSAKAGVWVPRTRSRRATCRYSCTRPSRRSRRHGRTVAVEGGGVRRALPRRLGRPGAAAVPLQLARRVRGGFGADTPRTLLLGRRRRARVVADQPGRPNRRAATGRPTVSVRTPLQPVVVGGVDRGSFGTPSAYARRDRTAPGQRMRSPPGPSPDVPDFSSSSPRWRPASERASTASQLSGQLRRREQLSPVPVECQVCEVAGARRLGTPMMVDVHCCRLRVMVEAGTPNRSRSAARLSPDDA
jgi:hypothetical protein